jgi:hypothetical protein
MSDTMTDTLAATIRQMYDAGDASPEGATTGWRQAPGGKSADALALARMRGAEEDDAEAALDSTVSAQNGDELAHLSGYARADADLDRLFKDAEQTGPAPRSEMAQDLIDAHDRATEDLLRLADVLIESSMTPRQRKWAWEFARGMRDGLARLVEDYT